MMFKLTKNIASTVLSLAIVGMVYLFVADTYKWWPFESVTETVKIDETPNVVTEIRGIKKYEELPENCRKYVEFIEEQIGYPITMVSNGPGRDDIIYRKSPLKK